jgi:hypothetical protein
MNDDLATGYLEDVIQRFQELKKLGDGAMAQIADPALSRSLDPETNSIAVMVKHLAGNMRSRWTDFLTTDGEKPSRDRDAEFELSGAVDRAQVLAWWEEGWGRLFQVLGQLQAEDLTRTVTIRQVPHTVVQAINRQLAHYAYHVGQMVLLARHFTGAAWQTLSVPRRKPQ